MTYITPLTLCRLLSDLNPLKTLIGPLTLYTSHPVYKKIISTFSEPDRLELSCLASGERTSQVCIRYRTCPTFKLIYLILAKAHFNFQQPNETFNSKIKIIFPLNYFSKAEQISSIHGNYLTRRLKICSFAKVKAAVRWQHFIIDFNLLLCTSLPACLQPSTATATLANQPCHRKNIFSITAGALPPSCNSWGRLHFTAQWKCGLPF